MNWQETGFALFITAMFLLLAAVVFFSQYASHVSKNTTAVFIILTLFLSFLIYRALTRRYRKKKKALSTSFPEKWQQILRENVIFYLNLNKNQQKKFEKQIQVFLAQVKINGINTFVSDKDRILVAASAVIPIFGFDEWEYKNLSEVMLYPQLFDEQFQSGKSKNISGMVGTGIMKDKMILSKPSLHRGFRNTSDKKNVAIHEFTHLIDMADGKADGIPEVLLKHQYTLPWLKLIKNKIMAIATKRSDINPYGATANEEFFAVVAEYFFERPHLLKRKHPELYKMLNQIFKQDLYRFFQIKNPMSKPRRNDPCPCGSGEKYKNCCAKTV